ncbi:MAG: DegT/DnrJ/EryC1/StrS family aminotransferase [Terriglobia bacterium]|jgi:dTDP-4-amino-4,6-dideoxygalactose transaminase
MSKPFDKPIYVTKPWLPPLEEFQRGLAEIWGRAWLTNNGPVLESFRAELAEYCGTENLCLFANGTLALQIALQGMGITGDVITTPYTFVATVHSLFWNKVRPVFVDIEPEHYTLDPEQVEAAITPWTSAILGVHVYGHPCRLEELERIAREHNLKLLYDAAHAFGVRVNGRPIGQFGDLSMFSFHATKLFHSVEGGMLTFGDGRLRRRFDYLKNFGFENEVEVVMPGTNAKMNELQALMGRLVLKGMGEIVEKRRHLAETYRRELMTIPGIRTAAPAGPGVEYNHAFFPIEVDEREFGASRDDLYNGLKEWNVFARRYFYPLVTDFACYRGIVREGELPVARSVAGRIITLPIFSDLGLDDVVRICDIIRHIHERRRSLPAGSRRGVLNIAAGPA